MKTEITNYAEAEAAIGAAFKESGELMDNRFAVIAGTHFDLTSCGPVSFLIEHDANGCCNMSLAGPKYMSAQSFKRVTVFDGNDGDGAGAATAEFLARINAALKRFD